MNTRRQSFISGALALLMVGSVAACSSAAATPTAAPATVAPATMAASAVSQAPATPAASPTVTPALLAKMLKAGKAEYGYGIVAPQAYIDSSGKLTGFTVEVARATLAGLGVPELDGVQVTGATRFTALTAHQFDFLDGAAVNAARCQVAVFSQPFIAVPYYFIYKATSTTKFTSWKDIAAAGARYGVQTGTNEAAQALLDGVTNEVLFQTQGDIVTGLQQGRADVTTANAAQAVTDLQTLGPDWVKSPPFAPLDANGIPRYSVLAWAFNPGDVATADAFSAEVTKLYKSGALLPIVSQFGFGQAELDNAFVWTPDQLCKSGATPAPSASK